MRIEQRLLLLSAILLAGMILLAPRTSYADSSLLKAADKQISGKKFKAAARTITKAMNSGDLSDKQMAEALYKRGVSYNGAGRHSSAIADLTGALWLGKLDGSAKKEAYRQRARAYQATGYKKLARRDLGKVGGSLPSRQNVAKKSGVAQAPLPIPSFNTVVRATKKTTLPSRPKVSSKPVAVKKVVIPAFRTSIATE